MIIMCCGCVSRGRITQTRIQCHNFAIVITRTNWIYVHMRARIQANNCMWTSILHIRLSYIHNKCNMVKSATVRGTCAEIICYSLYVFKLYACCFCVVSGSAAASSVHARLQFGAHTTTGRTGARNRTGSVHNAGRWHQIRNAGYSRRKCLIVLNKYRAIDDIPSS